MHVKTVHENAKPFTCLICKQSFRKNESLKKHVQTVHENATTCLISKQSFGQKETPKMHVKTVHENIKPFTCLD